MTDRKLTVEERAQVLAIVDAAEALRETVERITCGLAEVLDDADMLDPHRTIREMRSVEICGLLLLSAEAETDDLVDEATS